MSKVYLKKKKNVKGTINFFHIVVLSVGEQLFANFHSS